MATEGPRRRPAIASPGRAEDGQRIGKAPDGSFTPRSGETSVRGTAMSDTGDTGEPQPGWYPDPAAPTWSLRSWDGTEWTDKPTPAPAAGPGKGQSAPPAEKGA